MSVSPLRIIFVGSGVANAQCALTLKTLLKNGPTPKVSFKILEAASLPFGRMRQDTFKRIHPVAQIDIGGEIIHGDSETRTLLERLVKEKQEEWKKTHRPEIESDIRLVQMFDLKDPKAFSFFYTAAKDSKENRNKIRDLINQLDVDLEEYLEKNMSNDSLKGVSMYETYSILISNAFERDPTLKNWINKDTILQMLDARFGKTFGTIDTKNMGTRDIALEMSGMTDDDSENLVPTTGYGILRDYYLEHIGEHLHLNQEVVSIKYSNNSKNPVELTVVNPLTKVVTKEFADIVVVGVPLAVLQKEKIKFEPELSNAKKQAINKLQMSPGAKIFATFNNQSEVKKRWEERFDNTSLVFTADDPYIAQVWLSHVPSNHSQMVITGFTTGDRAGRLCELSEEEAEEKFKTLLSNMLGDDIVKKYYARSFIQNWTKDPYILGSYSCESINSFGSRVIVAENIEKKIYFAGEHCCTTAPATIHGAVRSGLETAEEILKHHQGSSLLQSKL